MMKHKLDYKKLTKLEKEIRQLLNFRLIDYSYEHIVVENYYALNNLIICRIELFGSSVLIEARIAKYEAELKENFYFEAERALKKQIEERLAKQAS